MPLVLRNVKGSPLSYNELDANFITLESLTISLKESGLLGDPDAVAYTIGPGLAYEPENDNLLKHGPTSNQGTVNNTGNDVIQSLTLDSFGHITKITSKNLNDEYVKFSGDQIITGNTTFIGTIEAATINTVDLNVNSNLEIDGFVRANSYQASGTAVPTITSTSNIFLDALDAVVIQQAPLRLATFETNQLAGQFGTPGDMVYDTQAQSPVYYNGEEWITIGTDSLAAGVGYTGSQGSVGFHGSTGFTGSGGEVGFTGSQGEQGPFGSQGSIGYTGSQGEQGPEGSVGFTGSQGEPGKDGAFAARGFDGSAGPIGFTGSGGARGNDGSKGFDGSKGDIGYTGSFGFTGSQGEFGYTGSQGSIGFTGSRGEPGISGSGGYDGSQGEQGWTGSQGSQGWTGSQGETGYDGSRGTQGYTGSQGYMGSKGYDGSQGSHGFTGSQGTQGYTGSRGTQGYTGSQGTQGYTGSQGTTGHTGSRGTTGHVGSQGTRGHTGSQGTQGYSGSRGYRGYSGSRGTRGYSGSRGVGGSRGSRGYTGSPAKNPDSITNGTTNAWVRSLRVGSGVSGTPSNGRIHAQGEIIAYYSDQRLKKDIVEIPDALLKVKALRGVTYSEVDDIAEKTGLDRSDKRHAGVLAQEVEAVMPEVVEQAPFDSGPDGKSKSGENYLTVKYEKLVPLLIEAIKDLTKKVEDLESKR
jgi:hypothetical protein